ncbi:circularly permuted type 2 ATP-grasp protein [Aquimarina pacifica]|uniref:circularly permuted type 2 ATP-grasp protein n=1 Tax=Aquimarina pacifica TaxID=1296415 RepID=UPI0004BA8B97|nr:circularly permuted type 2 ATP-grasp protein [Aquimarina pacifica]
MDLNTKEGLVRDYFSEHSYDEMFLSTMEIKPAWKNISNSLINMGRDELLSRQKDIDWMLSENGVTYNVYNDPKGLNRPWNLNIIPFVLLESEWRGIVKGLQQRVHLLDLVVKDIYGKRELIKNGIIPAEIVYGHRGFLRQCDQILYNTPKNISIYASDLSRGPDGRMWVVNDRAQAPSGMGYALENRATAGSVLSDVYKKNDVKRIDGFFRDFNKLLVESSPSKNPNPTIVIITPGPHNETYFEHAYLSSYFGYPLVRGNDLVVREGFLWMKSLKGLKKIDVVLRRVDDVFMDPLELREDSYLGVTGLLDVVRRQNVTVINPIGTGVIENSGLIPFMPAIAKYYLGEDLILPQIATWWCGQEKERSFVLENLSKFVIKRIDRSNREDIVFGEFLTSEEEVNLKNKISKSPYLYVAQEKITFSTVPNFTNERFEPRNMVCRAFAIAKGDDYRVMSGGLVRVSPEIKTRRVSNQRGGTSKDFCVLSESNNLENIHPVWQNDQKITVAKLDDLPSMTAENLYWTGRYLSRALITSRFLRMVLKQCTNSDLDIHTITENEKLHVLLRGVTKLTNTFPGFFDSSKGNPLPDIRKELTAVVFDKTKQGSLANILSSFNNSYYAIRNLWSTDMWRVFDSIQKICVLMEEKNESTDPVSLKAILKILDQLITRLIAIMGLIEESILVNQGLLLYFIGLNLEASIFKIKKLDILITKSTNKDMEYDLLECLLNSMESLNIYRYSYRSYITVENTLSLVLLNPEYARSLMYLVSRLRKDIGKLPFSENKGTLNNSQRFINEAFLKLKSITVTGLIDSSTEYRNVKENFKELLIELEEQLTGISIDITNTYFNHISVQCQLSTQSFPKE